MIRIQRKEQFAKAIERARKERMFVRPIRFREYAVTNKSNGRRYVVMFEVVGGKRFGTCSPVRRGARCAAIMCRSFAGTFSQPSPSTRRRCSSTGAIKAKGPGKHSESLLALNLHHFRDEGE